MRRVGIATPRTSIPDEITAKYEVNYTPSQDELGQIITDWETAHDTKWDDVGFVMTGDDEVHWLSHSVAKETYRIDVRRDNAEIINGASLLQALSNIREVVLRTL